MSIFGRNKMLVHSSDKFGTFRRRWPHCRPFKGHRQNQLQKPKRGTQSPQNRTGHIPMPSCLLSREEEERGTRRKNIVGLIQLVSSLYCSNHVCKTYNFWKLSMKHTETVVSRDVMTLEYMYNSVYHK